jgi:hypothetical protein
MYLLLKFKIRYIYKFYTFDILDFIEFCSKCCFNRIYTIQFTTNLISHQMSKDRIIIKEGEEFEEGGHKYRIK